MTNNEKIVKRVLATFKITERELKEHIKSRNHFYCRCALANILLSQGMTLHMVGDIIGRNHSTIAYYKKQHPILMKQSPSYKDCFTRCLIKT